MRLVGMLATGFAVLSLSFVTMGASALAPGASAQAQVVHPRHGGPGMRPGRGPVPRARGAYGRGYGHGYGRGYGRHHGRGWGGGAAGAAAAIGVLGILGAAAAANAAQPPAVYEDDCPLVRRRVWRDDGTYVIRRVPAC